MTALTLVRLPIGIARGLPLRQLPGARDQLVPFQAGGGADAFTLQA